MTMRRSRSDLVPKAPWLLSLVAFLIAALPTWQSYEGGTRFAAPGFALALATFPIVVARFLISQRTARTPNVNFGVLIVLVYVTAVLGLWSTVPPISLLNVHAPATAHLVSDRPFLEIAAFGVCLYTIQRARTFKQRSFILGFLLIGVTYSGIVGILQHIVQVDLTHILLPPGFIERRGVQSQMTAWRAGGLRAFGTYAGFGEFSATCASAIPLAIHFSRYGESRKIRVFSVIAVLTLMFAVPAGISRSGVIAMAVALAMYSPTFGIRQLGNGLAALATTIVAFFIFLPGSGQALTDTIVNSDRDASIVSRVEQYAMIDDITAVRPIFGLGIGAAPIDKYNAVDSQWLYSYSEGGIILLLAAILFVGGGLIGFRGELRVASDASEKSLAYATGAMFLGFVSTFFSFDTLSNVQGHIIVFLLFGLIWAGVFPDSPDTRQVVINDRPAFR